MAYMAQKETSITTTDYETRRIWFEKEKKRNDLSEIFYEKYMSRRA